jgi:hypothetical protein
MINIRPYKVSDVFVIVDLLSGIAKSGSSELRTLLTAGSNDSGSIVDGEQAAQERGIELVFFVLNKCYTESKDNLIKWFASLCEMTEAEFLNQPPETVLDVIEEIATRKESKDFFSRAYQLFRRIGDSRTVTTGA